MKPQNPLESQFATCLAELTISLSVEVTLLAQGPFSVEVNASIFECKSTKKNYDFKFIIDFCHRN